MSKNNPFPHLELASQKFLLKRFENDMLAVHQQMDILKIVFDNLKGSWFAVSSAYNIFKINAEENTEG